MLIALLTSTLLGTSPIPTATPAPARTASPTARWVAQAGGETIDYKERAKKGKFSFDFAKAEITDIVKAISDMTRRNFIIPDNLKSKRITILSPTKISADEAYRAFLTALSVNDITVVRSGKFYKLVGTKEAIKDTIPTCVGPDDRCPSYSDQMVTLLLRLKYIDANTINPIIKNLSSREAEVTIFQPTNALIISEYAPNLERIKRIIEALDQPGFDDELKIVQIQHATAAEIADKLTQIFEVQARGGSRPGVPPSPRKPRGSKESAAAGGNDDEDIQISKVIADDRTNQLIIKANQRSFDAIQKLIAKLDVPVTDGGRVRVYYLENADAEELASTLSSLASGQSGTRPPPRAQPNRGTPAAAAGGAGSAVLFSGDVKVTADKATNALIIVATGEDYRAMERLIEKLDTPRRQVYVEAAILEVTVSDKDEYGLNWHAPMRFSKNDIGSQLGGGRTIGFVQSAQSDGGISPTIAALSSPESLLGVAGGSLIGIVGKGISVPVGDSNLEIPAFGVILKWLESSTAANILSTPHILTSDNEEASIEVGQKIPFRRGTALPTALSGQAGAAGLSQFSNFFSSTDRIDVSLKLTITPHVNERNKVRMEIDQQIEDVVGIDEGTGQPITANRAAKTVVVVDDQQTVVLGGLMRDRKTDGDSKIPILGDLPLIGWLFRDETKNVEKVNLLLVLTPYIIHDKADFQQIFERKMQEYEEFAAEYYGHLEGYRAYINYAHKTGPLARLGSAVEHELAKPENGGTGLGSGETLISPQAESKGGAGEAGKATAPNADTEGAATPAPESEGDSEVILEGDKKPAAADQPEETP